MLDIYLIIVPEVIESWAALQTKTNAIQCTYASSRRGVSPQVGPLGGNINLKCTVLKFKIMTLPGIGSGSTLDGDLVNPTFLVNPKILKEANG